MTRNATTRQRVQVPKKHGQRSARDSRKMVYESRTRESGQKEKKTERLGLGRKDDPRGPSNPRPRRSGPLEPNTTLWGDSSAPISERQLGNTRHQPGSRNTGQYRRLLHFPTVVPQPPPFSLVKVDNSISWVPVRAHDVRRTESVPKPAQEVH